MSRIIVPSKKINTFSINRKRYVERESHARIGIEGWYTVRAIKPGYGIVRELSFPNLITNLGLNALGDQALFNRMHLGTGTTPPDVTDTALSNFGVNVVNSNPDSTTGASGSIPYYAYTRQTYTSAVGGATGTWTEIGISNQNTNGNLRSRALILDGSGNPTSFPVLADEQFQGTYEFRVYPPTSDSAESINLSGNPHNTITRALSVSGLSWVPNIHSGGIFISNTSSPAYTGGLAAITASAPNGTEIPGFVTVSSVAYGNNNFYRDSSVRHGAGQSIGNIMTQVFRMSCGVFQIEYDPVIVKLSTEEFIHNQRVSWARR